MIFFIIIGKGCFALLVMVPCKFHHHQNIVHLSAGLFFFIVVVVLFFPLERGALAFIKVGSWHSSQNLNVMCRYTGLLCVLKIVIVLYVVFVYMYTEIHQKY